MIHPGLRRAAAGLVVAVAVAACGGGGPGAPTGGTPTSPPESAVPTVEATATAAPVSAGKDACAALPREAIQGVVGTDPGEGELETIGGALGQATICRYDGDAQVTVEIDEGAGVADARVSIEAYGDTCEAIGDIGSEALFCTGGFKAMGFTGQIVWTDGQRTYFVVYNFGDATPSKDVVLGLARALSA